MRKNNQQSKSVRQEVLARVALTALACILIMSDASAAPSEDQSLKAIGDKLRNMILLGINTVAVVVAVVMVAVKGIGYAMKDSSERNEEDAKKLKAGLIRVAVGTAIAMGAGSIGTLPAAATLVPVAAAPTAGALKVPAEATAEVKDKVQALSERERSQLLSEDSLAVAARNAELPENMRLKASALLLKEAAIYQLGASKGGISILPRSIGVDATHLYICVEASNASKIDYYIDLQGFQTNFKRKGLAAAATGKEYMQPAGSYNEPQVLRAKQSYTYVLVYELFTLKKNQSLEFFIRETNGGRNVDVEIPSRYLYEHTYNL